jgi:hypothetical protein
MNQFFDQSVQERQEFQSLLTTFHRGLRRIHPKKRQEGKRTKEEGEVLPFALYCWIARHVLKKGINSVIGA